MSDIQPGPCVGCGLRNYSLSWGGPTICPACDVGSATPAVIEAQRKEIERLNSCLSDVTKDAERWRKLCGLMAYGEVTVDRAIYVDGGSAEKQMPFDWIGEMEGYIDGAPDLKAKAGHEDDARHSPYREPPK